MKYCFRCFSKIPTLANRCPNCVSDDQGVGGRIVFWLIIVGGLIWIARNAELVKGFLGL